MHYRIRKTALLPSIVQPAQPRFRYRLKRTLAVVVPIWPPPKRRGRTPADIPDPWSDLEWEEHPEAQQAVADHPAGMTLEEIGAYMRITRERVRQIEHQALAKLATNGGSDITWLGKLTLAVPECNKCGESFIRRRGRQTFCDTCEAGRKRKRRPSAYALQMAAYQQFQPQSAFA